MANVTTYLNFMGQAEEAMSSYAKAFGTVDSLVIRRFSDIPAGAGGPALAADEENAVMYSEVKIVGDHMLMATDVLKSMGQEIRIGNNVTINLNLDTRDEADRLYELLSQDSNEKSGMIEMFFGYWGSTLDRFGIRWMFNVAS